MSAPIRIQRKRTKGFKLQDTSPNGLPVVYVGRPTKFGNPFFHAQRFVGLEASLRCYRDAANGIFDPSNLKGMPDGPFYVACEDFKEWIRQFSDGPVDAIKRELRGKNLACWCPLDQPCHADVLLEIANEEAR